MLARAPRRPRRGPGRDRNRRGAEAPWARRAQPAADPTGAGHRRCGSRVAPASSSPRRTDPRRSCSGFHCYLVPRGDRELVVGATSEEQGYERIARAGGVFELLDAARSLLPGVDELALDEVSVGLRPATANTSRTSAARRSEDRGRRSGTTATAILLAPLTARRVVELLGADHEPARQRCPRRHGPTARRSARSSQAVAGTERGVAVSIDREVVPRSSWSTVELRPGARVEVLVAAAGG